MWHQWDNRLTVMNSIVYANNGGGIQITGAADWIRVSYSLIQKGYQGTGNSDFNPSLCPPSYTLVAGSPCIDAGHPGPGSGTA